MREVKVERRLSPLLPLLRKGGSCLWGELSGAVAEAEGDFEAVGVHEFFVGEDFSRRAVDLDAAVVEEDDAVAEVEDHFEVVAGDDLGGGTVMQEVDELPAGAGVEIAGGFVEGE